MGKLSVESLFVIPGAIQTADGAYGDLIAASGKPLLLVDEVVQKRLS